MKLTLEIFDKKGNSTMKEFNSVPVKGRIFREALRINKAVEAQGGTNLELDVTDDMVNLVTIIFGNQFTVDQYYDGILLEDLLIKTQEIIEEAIAPAVAKMQNVAKN